MGYERNDRRYGGGYGDDRNRDFGSDSGRSYGSSYGRGGAPRSDYNDYRGNRFGDRSDYGRSDYGREPRGYDYQDRGFFDRAGDEVRSWFGDEEAERRRRADERLDARYEGRADPRYRDGGRFAPYGSGYAGPTFGSGYGPDVGGGYSPSDYGAGRGAGATGNWGLGAGNDRNDWARDPGYHSWRERQIGEFDQDYAEYRLEHQQKFDNEFHSWRQTRQGQRGLLAQVQEHQEVVGSDGQHVGTVDHVRGDRIKLTKSDQDARGHHHSIPSSWLVSVDDKITISKTADQAKAHWRDEDRNSGDLFGRDDDRSTRLNRSFSGTY
ncbi:DUF2171 domain-containing protein [Sphingomonas sp. AP4-R1]|uniref:DUF2171 domain-containing protein n=1 Tax=Sphingomonas sp. AP4-R1 TaxID=2735134 RepID=UPI001493CF4E|nr:DUF2171 domain-containing protein [Sphingomonas sp. AP4-R1]QJU58959.1 DUF2171 domain-containing protein [Sphingomonas sp. AP4-R1]